MRAVSVTWAPRGCAPVRSCMTASACLFDSFMLFWREDIRRRGAPDDPGVDVAGVLRPPAPDLVMAMRHSHCAGITLDSAHGCGACLMQVYAAKADSLDPSAIIPRQDFDAKG